MSIKNENQILKELGINSWKNLSKDKFIQYVAMIPDISEEVRLKVLEQLPECINFTKDLVETIKVQQESILKNNLETTKSIISSLNSIQKSLELYSNNENLSFEEKKYYCDKQLELAKIYLELDKRNKDFLKYIWSGVVVFGLAILSFIGTLVGNKYLSAKKDLDDDL